VKDRTAYKAGEYCICVKCNTRMPHRRGVPCRDNKCPNCGRTMFREGGYHHQLFLEKEKKKEEQEKNKKGEGASDGNHDQK